jgi:copper chaperone CopZ
LGRKRTLRALMLLPLLLACRPLPAEYLQIRLKVYGLDCELCARGVGASVHRMAGVKSVEVSLKTGMIGIQLMPGNNLKMSDLRKRIQDNGFRPMEARVTALGRLNGSKFEVLGTGESYDVPDFDKDTAVPSELTFDIH